MKRPGVILIVLLNFSVLSMAQNRDVVRDSTKRDSVVLYTGTAKDSIVRDSTQFYNQLRKFSKKSKLGELFEKYILVDSSEYYGRGKKKNKEERKEGPEFKEEEGKIIRKIRVETYDPFGYDLEDSTQKPKSWFQKTGNTIHVKSLPPAITKFLLIKENEELDTFLLNESARLLRAQNYVRRVEFVPQPIDGAKDSLDILIKVLDSWSLIPKVEASGSHVNLGVYERNFMGMGHQVRLYYSKYFTDGNNGYEALYRVPNIQNTFVDFSAKYRRDHEHYHDKYIDISRRFYSTTTRWAGGAFFQDRFLARPFPTDTGVSANQGLKFLYQNYWVGHAFPISKKHNKPDHYRNLVITGGAFFVNYKERPSRDLDSIRYFSNEQFYLTEIALNSRQYVQDKYIFQDGEIEDVPVGSIYSVTTGVQRKNQAFRFYTGLRTAYGRYFDWGFLSGNLEIGSFMNRGRLEQGAISLKFNYFSNLKSIFGDWKVRQFIKPQVVIGFNREPTAMDRLSLNDEPYYRGFPGSEYLDYDNQDRYIDYNTGSIRGFESEASGTQKYVLDLQTQFYAPWNLWGFHVNPFADATFAYLAGRKHSFAGDKLYSSFTLGVIIRNDFLVFDAFQLSVSYYPRMPGLDGSSLRTNAFGNQDYGFQDFEMNKPRPVIYE